MTHASVSKARRSRPLNQERPSVDRWSAETSTVQRMLAPGSAHNPPIWCTHRVSKERTLRGRAASLSFEAVQSAEKKSLRAAAAVCWASSSDRTAGRAVSSI